MTSPTPRPETIEGLASAVPPALAMLAGKQLDLFTPLKDGPLSTEQIANALGVGSAWGTFSPLTASHAQTAPIANKTCLYSARA